MTNPFLKIDFVYVTKRNRADTYISSIGKHICSKALFGHYLIRRSYVAENSRHIRSNDVFP